MMTDEEILKLYATYESRLGAEMTKTLGNAALNLYAGLAAFFLPIPRENIPTLVSDLEADPFLENALNGSICELYHRYGMYLAPITTALTTLKHCQFEQKLPKENGESNRKSDSGGESEGEKPKES